MRVKRAFLAAGAFALMVCGFYGLGGVFMDDEGDTRLLKGRPWVDHMPKGPKDKIHVVFLAKDGPYGSTVHGSNFRHLVNGVRHNVAGRSLQIVTLQDNIKIKVDVRTWECDEAPGQLDLCMELGIRGRKIRLYSATEWDRAEDVPNEVRSMGAFVPTGGGGLSAREGRSPFEWSSDSVR